jgi:hypothetical protein
MVRQFESNVLEPQISNLERSSFALLCSLLSSLSLLSFAHSRSLFSTLSVYIAKKRLPAEGMDTAWFANLNPMSSNLKSRTSSVPLLLSCASFAHSGPLFSILSVYIAKKRGTCCNDAAASPHGRILSIRGWALALRPCSIACMLARNLRTPKQNPEEASRKRMVFHGQPDRSNS